MCCFNHIIGLPKKDGVPKQIHDYEVDLFNTLQDHKYVWIKKARGLGITEFMLRYILYLIFTGPVNKFNNAQIGVITGPRIDTAVDLIKRLKQLLRGVGVTTEDKETVIRLDNNVTIQAFPSNHMNAFRGFTNMKFIFLDEADFFRIDQQQEALDVSHGYIPKSDPQIVLCSTPNNPGGMFDRIESDAQSRYHKVFLPYTIGVGKIYEKDEIEEAKHFPSFEREYDLRYGYGTGNVFLHDKLQAAIQRDYDDPDISTIHGSSVSIGIDPGFGSSNFGIVVAALIDDVVTVLESEEHVRPDFAYIIDHMFDLIIKYQPVKIYVDAAAPAIIKALKIAINEDPEYEKVITQAKHDKVTRISDRMRIIPVGFGPEGKRMLATLQSFVNSGCLRIRPTYDKLITQMRTAKEINGLLDKSVIQSDSFDALRLACCLYDFRR